ncbi:hypothetical protein D3C87_1437880 [compost metagenome]
MRGDDLGFGIEFGVDQNGLGAHAFDVDAQHLAVDVILDFISDIEAGHRQGQRLQAIEFPLPVEGVADIVGA